MVTEQGKSHKSFYFFQKIWDPKCNKSWEWWAKPFAGELPSLLNRRTTFRGSSILIDFCDPRPLVNSTDEKEKVGCCSDITEWYLCLEGRLFGGNSEKNWWFFNMLWGNQKILVAGLAPSSPGLLPAVIRVLMFTAACKATSQQCYLPRVSALGSQKSIIFCI